MAYNHFQQLGLSQKYKCLHFMNKTLLLFVFIEKYTAIFEVNPKHLSHCAEEQQM